jgi:hypothetical protein
MEGIRGCWLKRLLAFGIVLILIFSSMILSFNTGANEISTTRTGNIGNQPITGFSEGNETIRIYNDTGVHKTWFDPLENITINISSDIVNYQPDGPGKQNKVTIMNYTGGIVDEYPTDAFFQHPGGPPYYYNITLQAPPIEDHYLIEVHIKEANNQPGKDQFLTWDVIQVGNGSDPMKNMTTYSESDCISPDWVFGSADIVYIKVYTPITVDPVDSEVTLADYMGNEFVIPIEDLSVSTVNEIENDSVIAFDLLNDLELDNFPDEVLKGNYWYTISVDLKDLTNGQMANGWAAQIRILPPPVIDETACDPAVIFAEGTNTTTLWTMFSDEDSVSASNFTVTFKVRDPNNDEIILIENQTHGIGGLNITELGNNSFNASYTWNPPDGAVLGDYDLYAMIFDDQNGYAEDEFNDNRNELTLLRSGVPPNINISNTTCEPAKINIMNNEMVTFIANFSDDNDPPVDINDFTLTFKIRYENNDQIIIAQNKRSGNLGDVAGSGNVLLTSYDTGLYSATITWNPQMTQEQGKYDLFFSVSTIFGTATDGFNNNLDELEIYSTGHPPDLTVGHTTCVPTSVDIISKKEIMIYCEFTDADNPAPEVFNVTFKIRPPSDKMADAITLVDNKAHDGPGEFGGNVKVEQSGSKYVASYNWVPPYWMDLGKYDLYFKVIDEWDNMAEDPFAQNQDELEITSSVEPPSIDAGDTICLPSSVNKIGNGTTKIFCEFSDSNFFNVTDFNITFKLRDPDDNEIILVDNKAVGSLGEDPNQKGTVEITYSGTVFTASYEWDPPLTTAVGKYDLYFAVMNLDGGFAKDKFDDNTDELDIVTTGYAPEIVETTCKPIKITIEGAETTTITAKFTDEDNPSPENFTVTFKVRGPKDNDTEIVLANDKTSNSTGELGGTVLVTNTTEGYTASIDWNPDNTVKPGKYDLYFSVKDELTFEAIDQFDNNLNELELITEVPSEEPDIQPELPTQEGNTYTFKITYSDPNNRPPNDQGVLLFIGVFTHKMLESDSGDDNYTDGKEYYFTIDLEEGEVQYKYKVTNDKNLTYETDLETITVKPEDKPDDGDDDEGNFFGIAVALIIIIIILLLLYFLFFQRKKPEHVEKEQEPPVAQPVPEHEPGEPAPPMAKTVSEDEEAKVAEEGEEPKEDERAGAEEPESIEEEPTAEEPVGEEPVAEEPTTEEPVAEESPVEEPAVEEPVAEEPKTEEPVSEESQAEEPVAEETKEPKEPAEGEPKPETEGEKPEETTKQE